MALLGKLFKIKKSETPAQTTKGKTAPATKPEAPSIDLSGLPDDQLVQALLTVQNTQQCLTALARVIQEADFVTIAAQHGVAAVRIAAAEKVTDFDLLQQLQAQSKNKDKAVFRLCKTRLSEQREAQQEQQARLERIGYLLDQVKYLTRIGYHPEFSGKLNILKQEWPDYCNEASAEAQAEMNTELAAAEKILEHYAQEEQAIAEQKQAINDARTQQQRLLEHSAELLEQAYELSADALEQKIQSLSQQWADNFRISKPNDEQGKAFEQQLQQLLSMQTVLKQHGDVAEKLEHWLQQEFDNAMTAVKQAEAWLGLLHWPDGITAPAWQAAFLNKLATLKADKKQLQQQQKSQLADVEQDLNAFEKAIKNGHVKDANKHNQRIIQAFRNLPSQSTAHLRRQQQALFAQLQEMRDWAGFATLPKKEALITSMQELIGSTIAPDLLAEKIHAMQEEWKSLSNAGVRDHELWQQFSQAAEQAFEPCKAFFAEQAKLRKAFAEQRQTLIAELQHYEQAMDWSTADWRAVQKTLDTARATFRTLGPIERSLHSKTQEQFNTVCDLIYAHLKHEYDRNLELKKSLVEQANALTSQENLQGIVDKVKALQTQWQQVGVTPRGPDQKLWKQFREQCDNIFKRLDEQREERKTELTETVTEAEQMVAQALQSNDSHALKEASQHLHSISLPKAVFQRLNKQLQEAQQAQALEAKQQALAGLFARLEHLHSDDETWQQACALPLASGFQAELFEQARSNADSNNDEAVDLCLLMEIAADLPSPEAEQAKRMALQVQRLADGLGKGLTPAEEAQQLVERWLHAKPEAAFAPRFIEALKQVL